MDNPDETAAPTPPPAKGGRSFWAEAIKAVIAFLAAQLVLAFGVPADDAVAGLLAVIGLDRTPVMAWWIAALGLAALFYLVIRRFGPAPATAV